MPALCAGGVALVAALSAAANALASAPAVSAPVAVTVSSSPVGSAVGAGFVGLATEYSDIEKEVGTNPAAPDAAFEQLARNLAPYGGLSLRIGGDTTDWTWWPVPGMKQPPWVRWSMTPVWAAVTKRLADDLHAHLIVGVNMEADSTRIARTEVSEIASHIRSVPTTYEIGNEPELYSKFPYYLNSAGKPIPGRPKSYSFSDIAAQWNQIADALPPLRLAGPGFSSLKALPAVGGFLDTTRKKLSLLTVHSYPLRATRCGGAMQKTRLFEPVSLQAVASNVSEWTSLARQYSVSLRVDEMNSVTCGGMPGLSNTFGPALWALNILPLYAEAGVSGVNFQTRPSTAQNLIQPLQTKSGWRVDVQPEYYGLLAFARLTPPGSRILQVSETPEGLYSWAVRKPDGQTAVVLTNVTANPASVVLRTAAADGTATVEFLRSASGGLWSTGRVTLGNQTISPRTGQLVGTPITQTVPSSDGSYDVNVPVASAAIVTFAH
jgi:hypothetical protein